MAGVDTVRGIAFQQAQAVLAAIDILDSTNLGSMRVEGIDDVVDIELFTMNGALNRGMQVKTRQPEYTWGKSELLAVLRRWAQLPNATDATFEFLTDGRLGPTGELVQNALSEASLGNREPLAELISADPDSPTCMTLSNACIRVDQTNTGGLLLRARQQVAAMLPEVMSKSDASVRSETAIGRLFQLLFERASQPAAIDRQVLRAEIAETLGVPEHQPTAKRWPGTLHDDYLSSVKKLDIGLISEPMVQADRSISWPGTSTYSNDPCQVTEMLNDVGPVILAGKTGTGKSTAARVLRLRGAQLGKVVLIAHAETYISGRVEGLVADAIANVVAQEIPFSTGRQALFDSSVVLVIDGVSEIPTPAQDSLQEDLRTLVAAGRGARVILLGRDIAAVRAMLPASLVPITYQTIGLGRQQRIELAQKILQPLGTPDEISNDGLDRARILTAQVDKVLGDAHGNPMLFTMGLDLFEEGTSFVSRATLYEKFIELLGARSGATHLSHVSACLGAVFASLLDQGRRYADPFEWDKLVEDKASTLGISRRINATLVDDIARRCGLIVPIGYTQTIAPMHDSFADFLSGRAHAKQLAQWPSKLIPSDDQRVLFAAEIGGVNQELAALVIRDRPFLVVRLADHDHADLDNDAPAHIASILRQLTGRIDSGVSLCRRANGQFVAFHTSKRPSQWITESEARELLETQTAAVVQGGTMTIVSRLWRKWLREELRPIGEIVPPPKDLEEAVSSLASHAAQVTACVRNYLTAVAPPGHGDELASILGPLGLYAIIGESQNGDWPVSYREAGEVTVNTTSADDQFQISAAHRGKSTVRHLLSTSPQREASTRILAAIDKLTLPRWVSQP